MPARGLQRDDRQSPLAGLEAEIGPIEMEPQLGVEPERRIPPDDEQQLVQRDDRRGQIRPVEQHAIAIHDPADPPHRGPTLG